MSSGWLRHLVVPLAFGLFGGACSGELEDTPAPSCATPAAADPTPTTRLLKTHTEVWPASQHALIGVPDLSKTLVATDGSLTPRYRKPADLDVATHPLLRFLLQIDGAVQKWALHTDHPGYPVPTLTTSAGGLQWQATAFGELLFGAPVDIVRVTVSNLGQSAQQGRLAIVTTSPDSCVAAEGDRLTALGQVLVAGWPTNPTAAQALARGLEVQTSVPLGESRTYWFVLPQKLAKTALPAADWPVGANLLTQHKARWDTLFAGSAQVEMADPWLAQAWRASLAHLVLLRDKVGDFYVVKPGAFAYNRFWYRDAAYIVRAFDLAGLPALAEQSLRVFWRGDVPKAVNAMAAFANSVAQEPSGMWQAPEKEWDGPGQALWGLVGHWLVTRDVAWLGQVWPAVRKGALYMAAARKTTDNTSFPLAVRGLFPKGYGEALIQSDFVLYHNYWGVFGLDLARQAAEGMGAAAEAKLLQSEHLAFRATVQQAATAAFVDKGGGVG